MAGPPAWLRDDPLVHRATGARVREVVPLAAGLGTRRFFRLLLDGPPGTLVARVEAPEDPSGRPAGAAPEPALEPLRTWLEQAGLPVPRSFGHAPERGLDLLEDLGDRTLADLLHGAAPQTRRACMARVVAWVPRLQRVPDAPEGLPAFRRRLDADTLAYKAELFATRSLPVALGRAPEPAERRAVAEGFAAIAECVAEAPARLAHRDLQSHNVMAPEGRAPDGAPRLVWIDLQGAWLAPPEYDLVSLLRDSYLELPDAEVDAHLDAVRSALPDAPAPSTLRRRFDLLTLARKGKDHARFLDAAARRGDRRFLEHLPATARALRAAAARVRGDDPRLDRLADLVAALPDAAPPGGPPCGG